MGEVQIFLDETGNRTMLPDGLTLSLGAGPAKVGGLTEALAMLAELPLTELATAAAPELEPGSDLPALDPAAATIEVVVSPPRDATKAVPLDRLPPLTRALIEMLRAGGSRTTPDVEVLKLIREGMPLDLRAYVHAWAMYAPRHTSVYEFWMDRPTLVEREFIREHAGDSIQLGIFASGEPIVARLNSSVSCEVVMIDEEGVPYRYYGLEGFLADLQMRTPQSAKFDLDDWLR